MTFRSHRLASLRVNFQLVLGFLVLLAAQGTGFADQSVPDHPLIGAPKQGRVVDHQPVSFQLATFPVGKIDDRKNVPAELLLRVEGNLSRHAYRVDADGPSAYQLHLSYKSALQTAGFELLFDCVKRSGCGREYAQYVVFGEEVVPSGFKSAPSFSDDSAIIGRKRFADGREVYVLEYIQPSLDGADSFVFQQVLETAAGEIVVAVKSSNELASELASQGWTELGGLFFAVDSAELLATSNEALEQIAGLLQANATQTYFVVGHTDSSGNIEHNMKLAKRRAEAVKQTLADQYAVASGALSAHGVGPLAPVSSNRSDVGREKNRRVVLVLR